MCASNQDRGVIAYPHERTHGEAFGDRNRSAWLVELIDALVADPQLWKDVRAIAEARGESVDHVVNTALRQYVNRNRRHLHAVPVDD